MIGNRSMRLSGLARLVSGVAIPAALALAGPTLADEPAQLPPDPKAAPEQKAPADVRPSLPVLAAPPADLAGCRATALAKQPAIHAARGSLDAALVRARALENLHVPGFLARDLPTRRKQACVGITVAQAGLQQAENNTIYAVTYCYLSAVYATEQVALADEILERLKDLEATTEDRIKGGVRNVSKPDLTYIRAVRAWGRARREEASLGRERALSALREAMGLPPDCPLQPVQQRLCELDLPVDRAVILHLAAERRPEVIQAANGVEVSALEVCAQAARRFYTAPTFASGSDIHAMPLPAGSYSATYEPGAVGPEMPVTMNGPRCDRVELARVYAVRAGSVLEKVRNLVLLDADQAFLRWQEARASLPVYREAQKEAEQYAKDTLELFKRETPRATVDQVLRANMLATQMRVRVNETRYQLLVSLAALERASAGGFQAGLEHCAPATADKAGEKEKAEDEAGKKNGGAEEKQ